METIRIFDTTDNVMSIELQKIIRQSVANIGGIDAVTVLQEVDNLLTVLNEENEEFLFNVDLEKNTIIYFD